MIQRIHELVGSRGGESIFIFTDLFLKFSNFPILNVVTKTDEYQSVPMT